MTPLELRGKLAEAGVSFDSDFEPILEKLIDLLCRKVDPKLADIEDPDNYAFALGFITGTSAMGILMEEIWTKRILQ